MPAPTQRPSPSRPRGRHGASRRLAVRAGLAATIGLALVVVVPAGLGGGTARAESLTPFADCAELAGWFADAARPYVGAYGLQGWPVGVQVPTAVEGDVDTGAVTPGTDQAVGSGPTGTNVQERGVDEPDLLKVDGVRVVAVHGDRLSVVDVSGPLPRLLGDLQLPAGHAQELLLVDGRALVFGADSERSDSAVLTLVDLADPRHPEVLRTESVDGGYLSAREHDGAVRVVLTTRPNLPFRLPGERQSEEDTTRQNRAILDAAPAQSWLPQHAVYDADGVERARGPLLDCAQVSRPAEPAGFGVLTVLTYDLRAPDAPRSEPLAIAADGDMVYASTDRLYVATTRGGWLSPQPVDTFQRWLPGARPAPSPVTTQLHGFDITDRSATAYLASGSVDGWLLGRWALSAENGYLRVATTRDGVPGEAGETGSDSAVTVLAEDGADLTVVGSVAGLGRGEQIRAVRWFGDLATVVTFRQTDPLYTVDLSDPAAPRVLGELKVTGYSGYLHPLGDGLLLGIGQEASESGQVSGAKIATFDLTDLASPSTVDSVVQRDAWADAEWESRAFSYLPDRRLAITPIGTPRGSALWSVAVGTDGSVRTAAQWLVPRQGWLVRAVPVGGDRMAAVTESPGGVALTVLSLTALSPTGSVPLG